MRTGRCRARLALLLAAALGLTGLTTATATATAGAAPRAAAEEPVEVHGLKGEYYTQSAPGAFDFHELKATGFDPQLDFPTLESRLAQATGRSDDVSVRWTGRIVPGKSGPTTFSVSADNGFRLWVDGRLLIDHWVDDWDIEQTADPVELTAGRAYDIKVEYFEHFGGSNFHLRWTPPAGTKTAVPQSAFLLPEGWDYDGAVATTVERDGRTLRLDFARPLAAPPGRPRRSSRRGDRRRPLAPRRRTAGPRRPQVPPRRPRTARRRQQVRNSARPRRRPLRRAGRPDPQ
ncbi:hypothetical protein GCM10020256_05720 [Streptomyces thermocoprophilus]